MKMIYKVKKKATATNRPNKFNEFQVWCQILLIFFSFFFLLHLKVSTEQLSSQKSVKESGHLHTQHCSHIWILDDVHMYLHMFVSTSVRQRLKY